MSIRHARRPLLTLLIAGAVAWPLACASAPPVVEVRIENYKFNPPTLKIKAGTTVKWLNEEKRTTHSVLFTGPSGFESERFFPGESWQRKFDKAGSYPYSCGPHPEMRGLVEVGP